MIPSLDAAMTMENSAFDLNWDRYDVFDDVSLSTKYQNQRKAVRYIRNDITVFVSQADIFGSYRLFSQSRAIKVKLLDISSRGSMIGGYSKLLLNLNQKIRLTLVFNSHKKFEIPAQVRREMIDGNVFYGTQFTKVENELGDYLLETQYDLLLR